MKHSLLLLLLLCPVVLHAQTYTSPDNEENLVYNPSFEAYVECPRKIDALGTLTTVEAWFQPSWGSADYFNVCGGRECGVPKNKLGVQHAHSGLGYCGIYCSKTDYREYLQTQLKHPLVAGRTYRLTFFVSLSEYSAGAVATIGGLLTRDRIYDTVRSVLMHKETRRLSDKVSQTVATYYMPQVVNDYNHPITNTADWIRVTDTFVAEGGEQFLTIGNFFPAAQSNLVDLDYLTYLLPGAYYYIDDVSLTCLNCTDTTSSLSTSPNFATPSPTIAVPDSNLRVGATFVLRNIFFDFDKSVLLQQSYVELLHLTEILNRHPRMRIEIGGHTDGRGSTDYNQRLSESRAKAVRDYLVSKGIDARRLQYKGYGKSIPIDSNETEEGRANNRRVEFKVLAM
ncbi:MAG: OmpA family protein [Bacteroidales bacterium]|nr:OmpA family protein [Bacteroidales bacterium]MBQ9639932.1 OmpA family protein [Bacteroidales bacterium]